ncbi:retrotransposon protein, putative, ty1-copia subclass [Tanacetum coccineum]
MQLTLDAYLLPYLFTRWSDVRQLKIVLSVEDKLDYLEQPIPPAPVPAQASQQVAPEALAAHTAWEEGQSVSSYVLKIKSYIDNLERLGHPVYLNPGVSLILISLRKEFDSFVKNYNMHSMGKTVNELHVMLKLHEQTLTKKDPVLHAIRAGKVQKKNNKQNKPQVAARGQNQGKGKSKLAYAPKPKIPTPPKRENPAKDSICHLCGDTGSLRIVGKMKQGALCWYVGKWSGAAVERLKVSFMDPLGISYCFEQLSLLPRGSTRGLFLVSIFVWSDGYVNRFVDNAISVSRNNLVYFSVVPRDGIFEIDLSNSNTIDSSMYAASNKRAKLNLDSALLWHCRLGHISKKRIEKLQHDGLLNSTDLRAFEKCVSCMSGKMERKPYTHQVKRAKDLLGLIHTDVCGPFRTVSRQGASYFVTFTNDFSRYGYVYLLKHKHEVFETFKVFQKEVENQLGKTIKSLRSDRGGEYMIQEFLDHLKEHGIIGQHTPPYTSQHNGMSERRNRTLLDMVRSMMSQITLPKSFWDYALETAARILLYGFPTNEGLLIPKDTKWDILFTTHLLPVNKVLVAQNAEFLENNLITQEASKSLEDLEIIQEEDMHPSIDTSLNHEIRDLGEHANYKAELLDPESDKWLNAMNVEMQSMKDNEVWDLVDLPPNDKIVGNKWLFKKKTDMDGATHL